MLNKDEIDGVVKATAEIVKAVPVYQDAVQPVAQEVGQALKTLGGVINVALSPLALLIYGFDSLKEVLSDKLEKRLSKTPPEDIIAPPLQVVGPLLEKYKFVYQDDDLSEMFVNLLANAMDKNQIQKAHPSFVAIISELSPDEAKLIKTISKQKSLPKLDIRLKNIDDEGNEKGYIHLYRNFTLLGKSALLTYPELTPSYLSNLERLNIISCPVDTFGDSYSDKKLYEPLETDPFILELKEKFPATPPQTESPVILDQRTISITDFGKLFINAVISD